LRSGDFDAALAELPPLNQQNTGVQAETALKLEGLRGTLRRHLEDPRSRYFDPERVMDLFSRYELVRDSLRTLGIFADLPIRQQPRPSQTSDHHGRGYIERRHLETLTDDIEYCLSVIHGTDVSPA